MFIASSSSRRCSTISMPTSAERRSSSPNNVVIWRLKSFLVSDCALSAYCCTHSRFLIARSWDALNRCMATWPASSANGRTDIVAAASATFPTMDVCFAPTGPHAFASPMRVRAMFSMRSEDSRSGILLACLAKLMSSAISSRTMQTSLRAPTASSAARCMSSRACSFLLDEAKTSHSSQFSVPCRSPSPRPMVQLRRQHANWHRDPDQQRS